jgi:iron complex outermembrane receptor protein
MIKDDADALNLAWEGKLGDTSVTTRVYWHDIEHVMDNYSLRPNTGTKMFAPATSTDVGLVLGGKRNMAGGRVSFGAEWLMNDFDTYQWNATTNVFASDILRDASRNRLGLYGEWQGVLTGAWSANLGLRSDTVMMDTGKVRSGAAKAEVAVGLGGAFNAASHEKTDHNWDWNALFQYAAAANRGYEVGLTRKTRSPSLLERYEWTPLNASAGQADNNTYLGNLNLKPEVAHALNLAVLGKTGGQTYKVGLFYQHVSDYIVGTPYTTDGIANVLRYENHDAQLHGLDGAWGYQLGAWQLESTLSYVRGRNLDSDTDLYRLAPLRMTLQVSHTQAAWKNSVAARMAQGQDDVAIYSKPGTGTALNNELTTPGYAVFDWHAQWQASKSVKVNFGIDNLFDKLYYDHLGGINRVTGGDIAVGARLPSAGRVAFAQLQWIL